MSTMPFYKYMQAKNMPDQSTCHFPEAVIRRYKKMLPVVLNGAFLKSRDDWELYNSFLAVQTMWF